MLSLMLKELRRNGFAYLVILAGIVITGSTTTSVYRNSLRDQSIAFERRVARLHLSVSERFARFETLLSGGRGLWLSSKNVENKEWSQFMLGFGGSNDLEQVKAFGFAVIASPDGQPLSKQDSRLDYSARVGLVEPKTVSKQLGNFDFARVPAIRERLEASVSDGLIQVVDGTSNLPDRVHADTLLIMPVFRGGETPATALERRQALVGWVFVACDRAAVINAFAREAGLNVDTYTGDPSQISRTDMEPGLSRSSPLRVASCGGRFSAVYSGEAKVGAPPEWLAGLTALVGTALSVILAILVYVLQHTRLCATAIAERMTARLRVEQAASIRLAMIAEQTPNPVMVIGTDGNLEWANTAFRCLADSIEAPGLFAAEVERACQASDGGRFFQRVSIADRVIELAGTPTTKEDGTPNGIVVIANDVTAHAEREQSLERARQDAEQASTLKSEFLANVSHEIRTPMNGVLGTAQLLLASDLQPDQREMAAVLMSSADSLLRLLNDVLDLSKFESGRLEFEAIAFDVRDLFEESLATYSALAVERGIELVCDLDLSVPAMTTGDSHRLRQVLVNLVGNALKFTDHGSVTVRAWADEHFHFEVVDTGVGIPADQFDSIFEPFRQADGSTTRKFGGTGLGLAIVKTIAEGMGGSIQVTSEVGKGSAFHVAVPLRVVEIAPSGSKVQVDIQAPPAHFRSVEGLLRRIGVQVGTGDSVLRAETQSGVVVGWDLDGRRLSHPLRAAALREALQGSHAIETERVADRYDLNVLLVDDNSVNRMVAVRLLEKTGCRVTAVGDGSEALNQLASTRFDLVLMDIQMPKMDGLTATRHWRKIERDLEQPRVPIIALTARAMPGDETECLEAGMDGYLGKPILLPQLREVLRRFSLAVRIAA